MQDRVILVSGSLIEYRGFCKSIAQALCPADERDLAGLDCVIGKTLTSLIAMEPRTRTGLWEQAAAMQSILISDEGRTLDQLLANDLAVTDDGTALLPLSHPARMQVVELTLPYPLNDADRRALEKLLPQLPELRYPMSEEDAAAFMDAYLHLKDRPAWEPVLMTAQEIERRKEEHDALVCQHQQILQQEFADRRLIALDCKHARVAVLAAGRYITREQAIAYLDRSGLVWRDQEEVGDRGVPVPQESQAHPDAPGETPRQVSRHKLTPEQRQQLLLFRKQLVDAGVTNFTQQTIEKFGVSDSYVRRLVRKSEESIAPTPFRAVKKK